eukprot:jgi/Picsp_1/5247/NSC_02609-R1_tissue factor pathway inhibitor
MIHHHHTALISALVSLLLRNTCTGSTAANNGTFCSLPPDNTESTGVSCFGIFTKFYYNETLNKCEEYVYGGCGATLNNFDSREGCEKAAETYCPDDTNDDDDNSTVVPQEGGDDTEGETEILVANTTKSPSPDDSTAAISNGTFCSLPPDETLDTGIACAAYIPKFYYNETLNKCEEYVYGGCGATLNNFDSREGCEKAAETYCPDDTNDGKEVDATSLQGQEDVMEFSVSASLSANHTAMLHLVVALHLLLLYV